MIIGGKRKQRYYQSVDQVTGKFVYTETTYTYVYICVCGSQLLEKYNLIGLLLILAGNFTRTVVKLEKMKLSIKKQVSIFQKLTHLFSNQKLLSF